MLVSRREVMAGGLSLLPSVALAQTGSAPPKVTVSVPIDHERPRLGHFALDCEWGAAPVPGRRTVLAVADGQQYFVRPGGAARLQKDLFGPGLNVLTIVGRSRSNAIERLVMKPDGTDWRTAYRLLNWTQWARDVAMVIDRLGLETKGLGLYGRSGGAHLIHQYLTLRPKTRARVYVQAAVNDDLDAVWGVGGDPFWSEFSSTDSALATRLLDWLRSHPEQRRSLILVLQRQNFFETLEALPAARQAAAKAFIDGDAAAVSEMRSRYQIDALEQMHSTLEGVGSAVRVYEFASPRPDLRNVQGPLRPSDEADFYYAEPLPDSSYRPPVRRTEWSKLREVAGDVLQVAGRYDHTCDYRTQIGLNGLTRNSKLVILDDNHVFKRWTDSGRQPAFVQAFFHEGTSGPGFERELDALGDLRWTEQPVTPARPPSHAARQATSRAI
jgi:hypothetical protein